MGSLVLKIAGVVAAACLAALALLRAQPGPDSAIRALLMPDDGCPLDCLLAIQPGKTSVDDALAVLEAHPWIAQVKATDRMIAWLWSGAQPPIIDAERIGWLRIDPQGKAIESINLQTTLPVGAVRLALGAPDTSGVTGYDPYLFQSSFYLDDGFGVYNVFTCPMIPRVYWNARVRISFVRPMTKWSVADAPATPFTCL